MIRRESIQGRVLADTGSQSRHSSWRVGLALLWPPFFVAAVYVSIGRLGFFPTDEGLVLAYAYRILHGQVPHRDFVSPRPLGSGLLHLIDFAIPGPLFEVSRVITLCEYVAYAVLFAWLIYALAPWRWGVAMVAGCAWSVLMNMNIFPLFAWYTVDGLLFVAAGLVVVQAGVTRDSFRLIAVGFLLVGTAALTKQSFVPGPAIAWLLLLPRLMPMGWTERVKQLVLTGVLGAVPSLIFVAVIAAFGGFVQLRHQLLGGAVVFGEPMLAQWSPRHDLLWLGILVPGAVVLGAVIASGQARRGLQLAARALLSALVIGVPLASQIGVSGSLWGDRLFWMAAFFWGARLFISKKWDGVGLVILGCAWMSSLSYGFPYPNFVAGGIGLYMLERAWSGFAIAEMRLPRALPAVAAIAALALTAAVFVPARRQAVYDDRPAAYLTADLANVSSAFGGILTNPSTQSYLAQMKSCIARYPARYVAVLPENAAMYPALGLDNPFPIDWLWPDDIHGSEAMIMSTVSRLNQSDDWLVMFQTVDEPQVLAGSPEPATPSSKIATLTPLTDQVYSALNGQHATCATFLVIYSPPAS